MIDGNLLQIAQLSFDFEGRVAVKSTVTMSWLLQACKLAPVIGHLSSKFEVLTGERSVWPDTLRITRYIGDWKFCFRRHFATTFLYDLDYKLKD